MKRNAIMKKKDYIFILILFAIIIGFVAYLFAKGYLFGSNTDWENQHIIIPEYFRTMFYKNGNIINAFALNLGMGQNIYYFSYYGLLSPLILISYLLPFIPMYIYIPLMSVSALLASVFMLYKWMLGKYGSNTAFLVTLIFALAGPMIYHSHRHVMFVVYMPFLIGTLKSIDEYFDKKSPTPLIIYTFLMIMTSYYYSVGGILVIGIYTIYKILKEKKKIKLENFKPLWKVIYFVIIGILISSVLLIPTIYTLFEGRLDTNTSINIASLFIPKITYKLTFYYSYSLGLTFIYVVSLIYNLIKKKKENFFISIILLLCMIFPVVSYLLNGLMYVDGKCFIPFLPLAAIMLGEFFKDLFDKKVNIKRLYFFLIPTVIFMLWSAVGYGNIELLLFDMALVLITLVVIGLSKKSWPIYVPVIVVSIVSCVLVNNNESYVRATDLKDQNNGAYSELIDSIKDDNVYRTANNDMILNNANKIYSSNELITSMYASSVNKNYLNFVRNVFQNEIINKDNTTVTQTSNVLFNVYSGSKYLVTHGSPLIGYKYVNDKNGVTLYQNEDVLPIGYASDKIMSLREFETLTYPQTIDALLNYVIVDKSIENVYESNVYNYSDGYKLNSFENLTYRNDNGHYLINSTNKGKMTIDLNSTINDQVLILKFKMNKQKIGNGCSTDITINGMKNSLSCTGWKYHNQNTTFEYVLSSNDEFNRLNIEFTDGEYDISDIEIYTMNYSKIKKLNNNVDEFVIDKVNSTNNKIVGKINVKNDGYFKISIPYESKGFKVYVDGQRVAKAKVDTAFLGFEITSGSHTVEIDYATPFLKLGIVMSIIGVVLLSTVVFYKDIKNPLNKIKEKLFAYLKWAYKKVSVFFIENKGYVLLFISMFLLDLALRIFYNVKVNYYHWFNPVPNLFSIAWILLILNLTRIFKKGIGKTIYLVAYIFSIIMFLVHAIYFSYFNLFFDYSVMRVAGEGTEYYETVLLNIKYWVVIISIISVYLTIRGLKTIKQDSKVNYTRLAIVLAAFALIKCGLPLFLGSKSTSIEWDDWRNARSVYSGFNDNNKSMMVAGMYEYNIRNFYVNFIRDNEKLTNDEQNVLNDNFKTNNVNTPNRYTGIFKGKSLIMVQLESLDDFLVTRDTMPTLYKLTKHSINFKNHYSFTSGGGSTFNSEFMVNTGYSSAYNYNQSGYSFSRNTYTYSLPNLFKNLGYSADAFHMNTSEYYSRGVNYKAFGYDNYYGLKDMDMYKNNTNYWLDTELIKNKTFNNEIFKNTPFLDYIITYSAHMPYKTTKGTCSMLTDEDGLTEEECLRLQARETDDMIKLLLENLEEKGLADNTVVVLYADHYIYTLEDESLLDKYKETSNNLINHTPFIIYNNGQTIKTVRDVNSQLDILPTVLNLFGIEYHPNDYIGRDILSNNYDPLVFFSDGSWYNGETYVANGEYQSGKEINDSTIDEYNSIVKKKMLLNDAIIKSDYFSEKND